MDRDNHNIFWDRIADRAKETIKTLKNNKVPSIIRYAVHITSACNMKCKYCRENHKYRIMDRKLFRSICKRAGYKGIVHITGGEPLLVPWLEEEIYNQRNRTRIALNTNLLIAPGLKALLSIFRLKTSLDDYCADRWNKTTGGNHFDKVVSNIKQASQTVKYTSICYTATHQNAHRLKEFIKFCKKNFPKLFSISVSFYKGYDSNLILTQKDISELYIASKIMDKISQQLFLETHTKRGNYFPNNVKIPCYLSMTERLIDENGKEYYCSHLYRDKVIAPGRPGLDKHCITGCNARFNKYNQIIHNTLNKEK